MDKRTLPVASMKTKAERIANNTKTEGDNMKNERGKNLKEHSGKNEKGNKNNRKGLIIIKINQNNIIIKEMNRESPKSIMLSNIHKETTL